MSSQPLNTQLNISWGGIKNRFVKFVSSTYFKASAAIAADTLNYITKNNIPISCAASALEDEIFASDMDIKRRGSRLEVVARNPNFGRCKAVIDTDPAGNYVLKKLTYYDLQKNTYKIK